MADSTRRSKDVGSPVQWLTRLNECFLNFGADPTENIRRIVILCAEVLDAALVFYDRPDETVRSPAVQSAGSGGHPDKDGGGHVCCRERNLDEEGPVVLRDLLNTECGAGNPDVAHLGLRVCARKAVRWQGEYCGTLTILFDREFDPDEQDIRIMQVLSSAIGVEEGRRLAERRLLQTEERYRLLVESAPDIIFSVTGRDGVINSLNPAFEKITGWPVGGWIGRPFLSLIHPDDVPVATRRFKAMAQGKVPRPSELRISTKSGGYVAGELTAMPQVQNGRISNISGIIRDISDRKNKEQELLRNRNLESVGVLAGGIAHDFNNLLMAVLGNIFLARNQVGPEHPAVQRLNDAERASLMAKDLVQQLVTFSKGGEPFKRVLALEHLLRDTVNLALVGSGVACECHVAEDLKAVEADEAQIRQVIHNLIANAREATDGGGAISLVASNAVLEEKEGIPLPPGAYVTIVVQDTGKGIPEQHLGKVFDPYFSTKQLGSQKGMGLGLALCHSIVKKHGGHISVRSKHREGSTFSVYLPASDKRAVTAKATPEPHPVERESSKGRILVMDDVAVVRDISVAMLNHLGFEVVCTKDGREAVDQYRREYERGTPFDAVILDLTVKGGMGGDRAVEELLAIDPGVRAIISTGYLREPIMEDYVTRGFKAAIAKPYKIEELGSLLQRIIG